MLALPLLTLPLRNHTGPLLTMSRQAEPYPSIPDKAPAHGTPAYQC